MELPSRFGLTSSDFRAPTFHALLARHSSSDTTYHGTSVGADFNVAWPAIGSLRLEIT